MEKWDKLSGTVGVVYNKMWRKYDGGMCALHTIYGKSEIELLLWDGPKWQNKTLRACSMFLIWVVLYKSGLDLIL